MPRTNLSNLYVCQEERYICIWQTDTRVYVIYRKRSPYKWRSGVNVLRRNSIRLAEVWLDDYKKYYYDR